MGNSILREIRSVCLPDLTMTDPSSAYRMGSVRVGQTNFGLLRKATSHADVGHGCSTT